MQAAPTRWRRTAADPLHLAAVPARHGCCHRRQVSFPVGGHGRRPGRHRDADRRHAGRATSTRPLRGRRRRLQRLAGAVSQKVPGLAGPVQAEPGPGERRRPRRPSRRPTTRDRHVHGSRAHGGGLRPAELTSDAGRHEPSASRSPGRRGSCRAPRPATGAADLAPRASSHLLRARLAAYVGPVTTRETNDMTYRQLGDSGLTVSTVGLGCNNFGAAPRPGRHQRRRRRRDRRRHHAVRHRRHLRPSGRERGAAREALGPAARRRRGGDEVRHGHAGRQRPRLGRARLPALHPHGGRGQPAPARHRLDRPLPAAQPRPAHADRGDPRRARRARRARARCATSAARNFTGWQVVDADWTARPAGTERFVSRAERVLPARARRRGRAGAGLRARRRRAAAVLPAGARAC